MADQCRVRPAVERAVARLLTVVGVAGDGENGDGICMAGENGDEIRRRWADCPIPMEGDTLAEWSAELGATPDPVHP